MSGKPDDEEREPASSRAFRPDEEEERAVASPRPVQLSPEFLSGATREVGRQGPPQGRDAKQAPEEGPGQEESAAKELDYKGSTEHLHESSQTSLGHATVVDTDGSAVNRMTYEFLRRREGHEALKGDEDYQDIMKRIAEQEKKAQEAKESAGPDDDLTITPERKALEEERKQYLEEYFKNNKVELTDEEKKDLHKHLNDSLDKEYPAKLSPTKGENGADVFKNSSGEFHSKMRDDGKYELSTNDTKFSGVVRVPRVDAKGNELNDCDIIEYCDGKPISIVAGREGKTNIHDFDKLLENTKGKGVSVSGVEEDRRAAAPAPEKERPTMGIQSAPPGRVVDRPRQDVGLRSAPPVLGRDGSREAPQPRPLEEDRSAAPQERPRETVGWRSVPPERVVRAATRDVQVLRAPRGPLSPSATPGKGPSRQQGAGIGGGAT